MRPDGSLWKAYPKIFVNDRTRQLMVNPAIRSSFFADLYVSPMEYDPGEPADRVGRLELAKGESAAIGELEVRFVGFNLEKEGNALAKMASGEQVTIAAMVDVRRGVPVVLHEMRPGRSTPAHKTGGCAAHSPDEIALVHFDIPVPA